MKNQRNSRFDERHKNSVIYTVARCLSLRFYLNMAECEILEDAFLAGSFVWQTPLKPYKNRLSSVFYTKTIKVDCRHCQWRQQQ